MFCNQCEQTSAGKACCRLGVCGKTDHVAHEQDALIAALRLLAERVVKKEEGTEEAEELVLFGLFSTLTNVNFDADSLHEITEDVLELYKELGGEAIPGDFFETAPSPDTFSEDVDIRSAMQILLFGLKGIAAYAYHAAQLNVIDHDLNKKVCTLLCARDDGKSLGDWVTLLLECGHCNVTAMALLDSANTGTFGNPLPVSVSLGHKAGPCILVSGHDLNDLYNVLVQTEGSGITVYSHGEMLPAHGYPKLHAFPHFAGHFGTAWQNQGKELPLFPGPVLFTTNCIQNPKNYADKVFTCGVVQWPGCTHIDPEDCSELIAKAKAMPGFAEDEEGKRILTGFGRQTLLDAAPTIVKAVQSGALRHVFVVGGCDGLKGARSYYTELVKKLPQESVVLTVGCGKFRFFTEDLGNLGPFPRLMDCGQCNDAYSLVAIALELAKLCDCSVNDLPLHIVLSWYEQKAVAVLLSLLALGVKKIRLGPSLPAFVSEKILSLLVENFEIAPITSVEEDLATFLGEK